MAHFCKDLHSLEFAILKNTNKKFLVVDYGLRQNPKIEAAQLKDEKSIDEIQAVLFDARVYEYHNDTDDMYLYD